MKKTSIIAISLIIFVSLIAGDVFAKTVVEVHCNCNLDTSEFKCTTKATGGTFLSWHKKYVDFDLIIHANDLHECNIGDLDVLIPISVKVINE